MICVIAFEHFVNNCDHEKIRRCIAIICLDRFVMYVFL